MAAQRFGEFNVTNTETLADIVEAALGCCYLASTYPKYLLRLFPRPNELWSRIENSIWWANDMKLFQYAIKGSKRSNDKGPMYGTADFNKVQQVALSIRSNPQFHRVVDGLWGTVITEPDDEGS